MNEPQILRVLVVEDNADHAELILAALGESPVKVVVAHVSDGQEALDYLHRRGACSAAAGEQPPDLVLLDLGLPRIDGLEVLRYIRATPQLRALPVVVLTTSSNDRDVLAAYAHHCNSYLLKPTDCGSLSELLATVLRYWTACNCLPEAAAGETG
ncbi:MAG: response regulator [Armatimonadetes bacterium]|nr:response regulator [Armatimonadota bacterium]